MRDLFNIGLLLSTIRLATPLILAALGGLYSERSGVINIALEGLMLAGAFTAASVTHYLQNPWAGLIAAICAGVLLSGALAGIGGAYLSIGQSSLFTRNMTSGRGFIALAALIFGKWRPVQTMLACLLFGFTDAIAIQLQGVRYGGEEIPNQFIQIIPYLLTIIVLAGFIGTSRAPRALGQPYEKER